jgi:sugar phosphate permease
VTSPPAGRTTPFHGWRVVTALFVVLAVSSGLGFYGVSVYKDALREAHGFSESSVSLGVALQFFAGGVVGLGVARVISQRDVRGIMSVGAVLAGAALVMLGRVEQLWAVYLAFIAFGAGFSASGLVPATTVVTRWFHVRRSMALSITSTGLSLGGIALTPLASWLIDEQGLRDGMTVIGIAYVIGVIPLTVLVVRSSPHDVGQEPDGAEAPPPGTVRHVEGTPFREAFHSAFFRYITGAYILVMVAQVGGIAHLFTVAKARVDPETARAVVSLLALSSVFARLLGGWIASRVRLVPLAAVFTALQFLGLVLIAVADTRLTILASTVVFGASVGNLLMLQPLILGDAFGVAEYPRIYATSQVFTMIGVAGGPYVLGAIYDWHGSWRLPYLIAAGASLAACAAMRVAEHALRRRETDAPPVPALH